MSEFFKPWRRKIGCVTLLMACVFAAGWVRSPFFTDVISYSTGENSADFWFSADSTFGWFGFRVDREKFSNGTPSVTIMGPDFPTWSTSPKGRDELWFLKSPRRWLGFNAGRKKNDIAGDFVLFAAVPYWSIVLPLIALSAYLLLSNPRQSTPSKIPVEPTSETVV